MLVQAFSLVIYDDLVHLAFSQFELPTINLVG